MPADSDPPKRYGHEEMLARLRAARSQGSSVKSVEKEIDAESGMVRVRRNKKRRNPKAGIPMFKDPGWFRFLRKAVFLGIPGLALLMVLAYVVLVASVGAGRFQEGLGRSMAKQLGLGQPIEIKDTSLSALILSIGQARLTGAPGLPVRSAVAEGAELRLGAKSFFGGDWDARFCTIRKAVVTLQTPVASGASWKQAPGLQAAGFLLADEPGAIHFSEISVWNAAVLFGGRDPLVSPGLRNVRAAFSLRDPEGGGPPYFDGQLSGGREGKLSLEGWPAMRVEAVRMAIFPDKARILRSAFHLGSDDEGRATPGGQNLIEAKGEIPFASNQTAALDLGVSRLMLRDILPKGVSRFCEAVLRSDKLQLTWDSADPSGTWRLRGPATLDFTRLRALQMLGLLQEASGVDLASVDFDSCELQLDLSPSGLALENIRAEAAGKMLLRGTLKISANGQLDGDLQLGLAQEILLQKIPPFFKAGAEGYLWADLKVGGTNLSPSEDLSAKLQAWTAGAGEATQRAPGAGSTPAAGDDAPATPKVPGKDKKDEWEDLFKSLTEPGKPIK